MSKPAKPDGFPLFPHDCGKWAKKVAGRTRYFGRWDDPAAALSEYEQFLAANVRPVERRSLALTVKAACNQFLAAKDKQRASGELTLVSWRHYRRCCQSVSDFFGATTAVASLQPLDFAGFKDHLSKRWGINAVGVEVTMTRTLFKWCYETRLIREPLLFGPSFRPPSAKAKRRQRRLAGKKLFTPEEIHRLLDAVGVQLRAMILLGINCGFGNSDCATLPLTAVDLEAGLIEYPRPKTEVERICPLWPETVDAMRTALARRPKPEPGFESLFFVRGPGRPWITTRCYIAPAFTEARQQAGVNERGTFYWLRHTFETIGGGSKDQIAVNAIMGHVDGHIAATYREEIDPARLVAVTNHVRSWLFGR